MDADPRRLESAEARQPRLDRRELERARAILDPVRRGEWRAAHIALRLALEVAAGHAVRGLPYRTLAAGRPILPLDHAPAFSLAHTSGLALVAVGAVGPLGVDVERIRPVKLTADRMARLIDVGAALVGDLRAPSPPHTDAAVIRAWTRLEAFGKALGTGIGPLLGDYDIAGRSAMPPATAGERARRARAQSGLVVRDLDIGRAGVRAAVAGPATVLLSQCLDDIGDVVRLLECVDRPI